MAHPAYRLGARLETFRTLGPYERGAVIRRLVEALAEADFYFLRAHRLPSLYGCNIRYRDTGDEWRDVPAVLQSRGGDCKDLCAWRCAELWLAGERGAAPRIVWIEDDTHPNEALYHVIVQRADGRYEDPSALLGMPT